MTFFFVAFVLTAIPIMFSGGQSWGRGTHLEGWVASACIPFALVFPIAVARIGREMESGISDDVLLGSSFAVIIISFIIGFATGSLKK